MTTQLDLETLPGIKPIDLTQAKCEAEHPWLSIIIPTRNEAQHIGATLDRAMTAASAEIIVVDGGSTDDTVATARRRGATVLSSAPGRGQQMNLGAVHARGETLLFLHADTLLPDQFDQQIRDALGSADVVAGAFRLCIDAPHRSLRLIAALANLRSRWRQMPYGDQAIFVKADAFRQLDGFKAIAAMEDFDLVRRLRRMGRIAIAPDAVVTSGRRWLRCGIWRTSLVHQCMIAGHFMGVSPDRLAAWRERR